MTASFDFFPFPSFVYNKNGRKEIIIIIICGKVASHVKLRKLICTNKCHIHYFIDIFQLVCEFKKVKNENTKYLNENSKSNALNHCDGDSDVDEIDLNYFSFLLFLSVVDNQQQ